MIVIKKAVIFLPALKSFDFEFIENFFITSIKWMSVIDVERNSKQYNLGI
jgi:hypothetical protein